MVKPALFCALALAGGAALLTAGCDAPRGLREDYMFKEWLEPSRTPKAVRRDGNGNAIIEPLRDTPPRQP